MPLTLTLREAPTVPLETEGLTPDRLAGRPRGEIEALTVWHGNRQAPLGDFFTVSGDGDAELRVEGDLGRVKFVGAGMAAGRLTIAGDGGMHTGAEMRGGELVVEGDVGDFAGTGMRGGRLVVRGSAGPPARRCTTGRASRDARRRDPRPRRRRRAGRRRPPARADRRRGTGGRRRGAAHAGGHDRRSRPARRRARGGHAARHDRGHVGGDAAAHLRLRVLVPPALPAPLPAPPARAWASRWPTSRSRAATRAGAETASSCGGARS